MDVLNVVLIVIVVAAVVIAVVSLVSGINASRDAKALRAAYFESKYGSSVNRMLAECPVDHARLQTIRDAKRSGPADAARELLQTEPVPLFAAAEFVKRI
jgi:hypothetical protein